MTHKDKKKHKENYKRNTKEKPKNNYKKRNTTNTEIAIKKEIRQTRNENYREKNIKTFEDTLNLCRENNALKESIISSKENQELIKDGEDINPQINRFDEPLKIILSKKRTLEAANDYENKKIAILNFASAINPGGAVLRGSSTQEESICRCSTLYPCISSDEMIETFYKTHRKSIKTKDMNNLYNDDCIFTPDVKVFKSDTNSPELLSQEEWYDVDVITCAAPNLREKLNHTKDFIQSEISNEKLKELHIKRFKQIINIAIKNNADVLILGAFGCGAFRNPPEIVAKAMYEVIQEHMYSFNTIEFAIYSSKKESKNYKVFKEILKTKK